MYLSRWSVIDFILDRSCDVNEWVSDCKSVTSPCLRSRPTFERTRSLGDHSLEHARRDHRTNISRAAEYLGIARPRLFVVLSEGRVEGFCRLSEEHFPGVPHFLLSRRYRQASYELFALVIRLDEILGVLRGNCQEDPDLMERNALVN